MKTWRKNYVSSMANELVVVRLSQNYGGMRCAVSLFKCIFTTVG
jgi:hypothetical protein